MIATVAAVCPPGLVSESRLPPCAACPPFTFWQNASTCVDCPAKSNYTRGPQGGANITACKGLNFQLVVCI